MFSKKYLTLFIGKNIIDFGVITSSQTPSFEGLEAISYTPETLVSALTQIRNSSKKAVRCVLGEELVYVTSFSLPKTTEINREKVLHIAEKSIPENLKDTAWDFQTLEYNETPISETTTMIQIAVVESLFTKNFINALSTNGILPELILPESCALAHLVSDLEGVSVIVEVNRENVLFIAAEKGGVWATYVSSHGDISTNLVNFIEFLSQKKERKINRIILSRCDEKHPSFSSVFIIRKL